MDLKNTIEDLVINRKSNLARKLIAAWLKENQGSIKNNYIYQACEWYRRLALYKEGFHLLNLNEERGNIERERILWAIRFLNYIGATQYALQLIKPLGNCHGAERVFVGSVYLGNFDFPNAYKHYQAWHQEFYENHSYHARLTRLSLADTYCGMGNYQKAIELAEMIYHDSPEPLLKGICLAALGEYYVRMGSVDKSIKYFNDAARLIPRKDNAIDHSLLKKWQGYAYCQLGEKKYGAHLLQQAYREQKLASLRPEVWLDTIRLMIQCGLYDIDFAKRITAYPGLAKGLLNRFALGDHEVQIFDQKHTKHYLKIYLDSNEYEWHGKLYYKIPLELKLIAYVCLAQTYGLPTIRAINLLWPNEFYALLQLYTRIRSLIHRANKVYKAGIYVRDDHLYISRSSQIFVSTLVSSKISSPISSGIFSTNSHPTAKDLANYYNCSISKGRQLYLTHLSK